MIKDAKPLTIEQIIQMGKEARKRLAKLPMYEQQVIEYVHSKCCGK